MLPTFVIGLREGLEAALIVGIIAAFLRKQGRTDVLRQVWVGVGAAVLICAAVGIGLDAYSRDLPQRQQEALETVIGVLAVGMVTYMVIWMKEHSRGLKAQLESMASDALAADDARTGSRAGTAMVAMAFLAVLREGFETAVFLLAAFNESGSGANALIGALLGVAVAVGLGYGIYRGGVRINLSRFFRATGLVLVLVAAGLVATALHTAHEAGWLDAGQQQVLDLSWLVQPGTVLSSLVTGILGLQPRPVLVEVLGWLLYAVPVAIFVAWPAARKVPRRSLVGGTSTAAVAAVAVLAVAPGTGSPEAATVNAHEQAVRSATVTVTAAEGCSIDHTTFAAGGIDFRIANTDATAVTEVELLSGDRIVGEKENLPPGFRGTFSVTAQAGDYTLFCPGASTEKTPIRVTGTASTPDADTATLLRGATAGYKKYVDTQVGYLLAATRKLDTALHGHDVRAARVAYAKARPFYEKIEPFAESFSIGKVSLDADIDARANDVPASHFRGFHRIEKGLWADGTTAGLASYGERLVADVTRLERLTKRLTYQPTELANGAQELLDEVAATKITGEEERYSHLDLLDVANNVEGSEQAFAQLQPVISQLDPGLATKIRHRFAALDQLVDSYRDPSEPSGYRLYTELDDADKRGLAAAVKAVQEPLSQVAAKVAG